MSKIFCDHSLLWEYILHSADNNGVKVLKQQIGKASAIVAGGV